MTARHRFLNRQRKTRRGATVAEFAIVAPVFFLFVLAGFEFVRVHTLRNSTNNAAYEACRHSIVPGASRQEAIDAADEVMAIVSARDVTYEVTPDVIDDTTEEVTVRVTLPMRSNTLVVPVFSRSLTITSECRLRTERGRVAS